jgi:hypothetical protein
MTYDDAQEEIAQNSGMLAAAGGGKSGQKKGKDKMDGSVTFLLGNIARCLFFSVTMNICDPITPRNE